MRAVADARGFMFDLDGTLVRRARDGAATAIAGAIDVLAAIRASGRPLVVFTNASQVAPARIAAGVRSAGLELADDEVLTPVCSAISHIARRHAGARVLVIATDAVKQRIAAAGIDVVDADPQVVFVAHADHVDLDVLEAAAHAIHAGARFYTGSYLRAYAGADGPILSRGAMIAAAVAKASARRPTVVGKPSRAAVREISGRLGVPARDVAFVGDDVAMDIALGRLGGGRTVLVASGISGRASAGADLVVDHVGELLPLLWT